MGESSGTRMNNISWKCFTVIHSFSEGVIMINSCKVGSFHLEAGSQSVIDVLGGLMY